MKLFRRQPVPSARQVRDEWLQWLELGGARPATVKGYRSTTDRLLNRYPELALGEFTDEHILGVIEEANPRSRQMPDAASMSREEWTEARFGDGRCACDQCWDADVYRIEADRCMSDYDALEVDVGIMLEALTKIAALRPNKAFDPWARAIAEEAIAKLSERVTDLAAS